MQCFQGGDVGRRWQHTTQKTGPLHAVRTNEDECHGKKTNGIFNFQVFDRGSITVVGNDRGRFSRARSRALFAAQSERVRVCVCKGDYRKTDQTVITVCDDVVV